MLEKFNAKSSFPELKLLLYSFLMFMKEPFQSVTDVLLDCRRGTMMVGDIEYAIFSAYFHCQFAAFTGEHLSHVEKVCNALSKEMVSKISYVANLIFFWWLFSFVPLLIDKFFYCLDSLKAKPIHS